MQNGQDTYRGKTMSQHQGTWTIWVEEHYELLLSRATALFHGKTELASDFLHDLLLELRRKWTQVDNPQAWISSTMRYRIADYFSTQKEVAQALHEETQAPNDPSLQIDAETAIARLPRKLRDVLTLFLQGRSITQIAEQSKLSTDAVYQRLSRARKQLKHSLGGQPHGSKLQRRATTNFTFSV